MAISLVRDQYDNPSGGLSQFTVDMGTAPADGNTLILCFRAKSSTQTISSITQTGATWALVKRSNTNWSSEIWMATNVSGASRSFTVHLSAGTPSGVRVITSEWTGWSGGLTVDQTGANNGVSTNPSSASITTTKPNALLVATVAQNASGSPTSPTNSFTQFPSDLTGDQFAAAYRIVSATGTYSTGWTDSTSTSWDSAIADVYGGLKNTTTLSGGITPAGPLRKKAIFRKNGALTPSNSLFRVGRVQFKALAGAITSAGSIVGHKIQNRTLGGTITPAASRLLSSLRAPYNWGAFRDSRYVRWENLPGVFGGGGGRRRRRR